MRLDPANVRALALFRALLTQVRWVTLSGPAGSVLQPVGLDYAALPAVAQALRLRLSPALLADLQTCEAEALGTWGK